MSANYTAYAITANTSGSVKYDWIYLKLDPAKAAAPAAGSTDVINLYTSRSTSNTSDNGTPPTYGLVLAVVTVANGASSIVNANISDKRVKITTTSPGLVTNAALAGSITADKFVAGMPVQMAITTYNSSDTTTTVMNDDDTAPTNTEGKEFMSITFTPKSATNVLVVKASGLFAPSASDTVNLALFAGSASNCFAASGIYQGNINGKFMIPVTGSMVAGTTSAMTFKFRAGPGTAGTTLTFNGQTGARRFGDVNKSFIEVIEYKA
jgi:hypothetical protein